MDNNIASFIRQHIDETREELFIRIVDRNGEVFREYGYFIPNMMQVFRRLKNNKIGSTRTSVAQYIYTSILLSIDGASRLTIVDDPTINYPCFSFM